mmetsp:Transcript_23377/g.34199  ORF Transcript_23377/g.34199 Transcript_23377/m.34199 type:complete len:112 (+) Transcript_23377:83-418(+)
MKQAIYSLFVLLISLCATTQAFTTVSSSSITTTSTTELNLFGIGEAKDDGSPGDYLCKDCGYVFTKGPAAWAKLDDKYGCPPCGAPKFRFKKVPKGSESGKVEVKKSWFGN